MLHSSTFENWAAMLQASRCDAGPSSSAHEVRERTRHRLSRIIGTNHDLSVLGISGWIEPLSTSSSTFNLHIILGVR